MQGIRLAKLQDELESGRTIPSYFFPDGTQDSGLSHFEARELLKKKGWSYRKAAPVLGVCYQHLSDVLNGQRESRRIINAIAELPEAPNARN